MSRIHNAISKISQVSNTPQPFLPLVEVLGNHYALVENHSGVVGYCTDRICIKVRCGFIEVHGSGLRISKMTDAQMIIQGKRQKISLNYGGEK